MIPLLPRFGGAFYFETPYSRITCAGLGNYGLGACYRQVWSTEIPVARTRQSRAFAELPLEQQLEKLRQIRAVLTVVASKCSMPRRCEVLGCKAGRESFPL